MVIATFGPTTEPAKTRTSFADRRFALDSADHQNGNREGARMRRCAVVFFVIVVALYAGACGGTQSGTAQAESTPATSATPAAQATAQTPSTPEDLEITESGWGMSYGYVQYGIVIRNPNTAFAGDFVSIDIQMDGKSGQILGVDNQVLGMIFPGQTLAWGGQADPNGKKPSKITFSVSVGSDNWYEAGSTAVTDKAYEPFEITRTHVGKDSIGSPVVTGLLENPNDTPFDSIAVSVILKDASGKIVGGYTDYVDNVQAGGKKPVEVGAYSGMPRFKSVDVYAQSWDF
jgi:hypothetical protein